MKSQLALDEVALDPDLRHINFFNGRLLSGEDLNAERDANRAQARHLGQATGSGVAWGFEVSLAKDVSSPDVAVEIKAGLAVNHCGRVLRLKCDRVVSLVRRPDASRQPECVF